MPFNLPDDRCPDCAHALHLRKVCGWWKDTPNIDRDVIPCNCFLVETMDGELISADQLVARCDTLNNTVKALEQELFRARML